MSTHTTRVLALNAVCRLLSLGIILLLPTQLTHDRFHISKTDNLAKTAHTIDVIFPASEIISVGDSRN
jgi:hypothetical protein